MPAKGPAYKRVIDLEIGDLVIRQPPRRDKVWEVTLVNIPQGPGFFAATLHFDTVTEDGEWVEISRAAMFNDTYRLAGPIQSKRYRADAARYRRS